MYSMSDYEYLKTQTSAYHRIALIHEIENRQTMRITFVEQIGLDFNRLKPVQNTLYNYTYTDNSIYQYNNTNYTLKKIN
jgi:hypothetical protein